jgi:coenzyme F420-reducing hydrogenase delta subunit
VALVDENIEDLAVRIKRIREEMFSRNEAENLQNEFSRQSKMLEELQTKLEG